MSTMSDSERDAFLLEPRLGTLGVAREGKGPLLAPIWYRYNPGGIIEFCIGESSAKARRLRAEGRATLSVIDEGRPGPYRNVTAEGPVSLVLLGDATRREILAMSSRYLGENGGMRYTEQFMSKLAADELHTSHGAGEVLGTLTPQRWRTEVL